MEDRTTTNHNRITEKCRKLFNRELTEAALQAWVNELDSKRRRGLISFTVPTEAIDPLACLERWPHSDTFQYYWEHPDNDFGLAGADSAIHLYNSGKERFSDIENQVQDLQNSSLQFSDIEHTHKGLHFLGGFSFDRETHNKNWKTFDAARFTVPRWLIVKDGKISLLILTISVDPQGDTRLTVKHKFNGLLKALDPVLSLYESHKNTEQGIPHQGINFKLQQSPSAYKHWETSVNEAKNLIRKEHIDKIVLARQVKIESDETIAATRALNQLRSRYSNCYCFLIQFARNRTFIGCSPERLVKFTPRYILTDGLAGSITRGKSATEDTLLENRLLNSSKDLDEHGYVVDSIIKRLRPLSTSIKRASTPSIKKLHNVQHLHTPITAWLSGNVKRSDILKSLHPTPAVGGLPTSKALPLIRQLENFDRGWYASPVGWLLGKHHGEFTVAIRSGLIMTDTAHFFAGCGIVSHSKAKEEWEETKLKLIPMLTALEYG